MGTRQRERRQDKRERERGTEKERKATRRQRRCRNETWTKPGLRWRRERDETKQGSDRRTHGGTVSERQGQRQTQRRNQG